MRGPHVCVRAVLKGFTALLRYLCPSALTPERTHERSLLPPPPSDWEHFEPHFLNALKLFPELEEVGVEMLNGPESFTPDGRYILGEAPELNKCFVAAGMNSSGIASAGGAGKALAEWMEHGEPINDLWPLDIRRFGKHDGAPTFLKDRVSETLGLHYLMPYPRKELMSCRNVRQSPLYERLDACGAVWGSKFGWERPLYFRPPGDDEQDDTATNFNGPNDWLTFDKPLWLPLVENETRACREACALFDVTSFGKVLVQGKDAALLMDRVCANDVAAVGMGHRLVYTGMLNERGGYEADITVSRKGNDASMLTTATSNVVRDMAWLRAQLKELRRLHRDDHNVGGGPLEVTLADVTGQFSIISLMGPTSRQVLQHLTARPHGLTAEHFPFGTSKDIDVGNVEVTANRVSYVGELGYELVVPQEYARNVYDSLHGVRLGDGSDSATAVTNAGYYAIESMRIEKGYRAWGHELDPEMTPKSAGLNFTVSKEKDDFIGKDALLRPSGGGGGGRIISGKDSSSSSRRVASFVFEDESVMPWSGEPIVMNGEEYVGHLTSATYGCELRRGVGLGIIRHPDVWRKGFLKAHTWEVHVGSRVAKVRATFKPPVAKRGVE